VLSKVIDFQRNGEKKPTMKELIKRQVEKDPVLVELVDGMTEEQVEEAYKATEGTLLKFVERIEATNKEVAEYIADFVDKDGGSILVMTSLINHVVDFCTQVPKKVEGADLLDNAYQTVLTSEMYRVVEEAIRGVLRKHKKEE
jgi:hypothetical protein